MAEQDAMGKRYMSKNDIFADAFNFLIYKGDTVIQPEGLREVDTSEIALPYGNNAHFVVQKYRDIKKLWAVKQDDKAIYVLFGGELQQKVHYAMPVKNMLYDAIDYAKQVDEARRSYRRKDGELSIEQNVLKVKLTSEEFLSGFRKEDRLIPVITAVIYFGANDWDGPLSTHEMMDVDDKRLYDAIPNYFVNLLAPARMTDSDFDKFHTDLGVALKVLKYQNRGAGQIILGLNHRKIRRDTADFINSQARLGLVFEEEIEEGDVDMCKAMEILIRDERRDARAEGAQNNLLQNVRKMMKNLNLTLEQVFAALEIPSSDQTRLRALL